ARCPPRAPARGAFVVLRAAHDEGRPMARAEKESAVAELTERFRSASGVVLTEYRGLTVSQLRELRKTLDGNAQFSVVKNTLTKIATNEAGITTQVGHLPLGRSGLA